MITAPCASSHQAIQALAFFRDLAVPGFRDVKTVVAKRGVHVCLFIPTACSAYAHCMQFEMGSSPTVAAEVRLSPNRRAEISHL
jgi:hypothetical protein